VRELLLGREESSLPTFTERATSLEGFLRGASAPAPAPHLPRRAPLWILSGGGDSVVLAGRLSASLSLTVMHSSAGRQSPESVRRYLDAHAGEREPGWNVAVAGVCAETHAEAVALAAEHEDRFIHPTVVGAPHEVAEKLAALADAYSTDEIVFCDVAPSRDARHRSLQLIAEACGVGRRTAAPSANSDAGSHDAAR
jgi:alkanesulfonate monooxygenase SsuD/methylene tetrahydromethanopterin reductase-like flavin-dependent oxidoreductase (luciferase family)